MAAAAPKVCNHAPIRTLHKSNQITISNSFTISTTFSNLRTWKLARNRLWNQHEQMYIYYLITFAAGAYLIAACRDDASLKSNSNSKSFCLYLISDEVRVAPLEFCTLFFVCRAHLFCVENMCQALSFICSTPYIACIYISYSWSISRNEVFVSKNGFVVFQNILNKVALNATKEQLIIKIVLKSSIIIYRTIIWSMIAL